LREVETGRLVEQHRDVRPVGQDGTDGLGDIRGGQGACGDLIEQRLEQVMIGAVNERDTRIGVMEFFAERQAAKARAEHDDMNLFASLHAERLNQVLKIAIQQFCQP